MIYNPTIVDRLIGCLIKDSSLCTNVKYPMDKNDFTVKSSMNEEPRCLLHRTLWATVNNLARKGCRNVSYVEIESFLQPYPAYMEIYNNHDGRKYIQSILKLSKIENFEYYYEQTRLYSCVRDYQALGYDISKFWDINKKDEDNIAGLDNVKVEDVINHFDSASAKLNKKYKLRKDAEEMICGDGVDDLLDSLEEDPMLGAGLSSPMLNSLYRGWCKGHLILRGSPSSFGKTTMGISDQVNVSCKKIWSNDKQDFIDNPYYQGCSAYFHSEQKTVTEIQPRFLANISGVPYHTILDGKFTKDEKERISEAGKISKDSRLKIINYPTFTANGYKEYIRELALDGYEYITVDYLWDNFYIGAELKQLSGGMNIRQDMALLHLTDVLKISAEYNNVAIATMVQLNGNEKVAEIVDESCLFGSKSIKTKLDNGSVYMAPRAKELAMAQDLITKWNAEHSSKFGGNLYPTAISHCFKTRYSRYGMNIKVWHHVDNSIGKMTDMFATTWDGTPIKIPELYIERR